VSSYVWTPRKPLRHAEKHVDFQLHYDHVTARRAESERLAMRRAKRIAFATSTTGYAPLPQVQLLAGSLERSLYRTAVFGYRQVRAEIARLRAGHPRAMLVVRDAGGYSRAARGGMTEVQKLVRHRAQIAASSVASAALAADREARLKPGATALDIQAAVSAATARSLHNHVIEAVGEVLNLGRATGALSLASPPQFALRSEQLDLNTCEACEELHGTVVEVDSAEFYDLMPPAQCYGEGRCRGIYVFGDSGDSGGDMAEPLAEAA
jgi:hypothetical protein